MVSVYIISKDRKDFLKKAIQSCLSQSYKNIEIIVVDDCSESFNIEDLKEEFPQVIFYRMDKASGANVCRNKALNLASGRYITGLDDDDYFTRDRVEVMLKFYEKYCDRISAVSTRHLFESVYLKKSLKYRLKNLSSYLLKGQVIGLNSILNKNNIGNQVLTEVERLKAIGGFDNDLPALQDYETWIRLIKKFGPIYRINTFSYIKNDKTVSITNENRSKLKGFDFIFEKHRDIFKNREHCFELHKVLYRQKFVSLSQFFKFFRPGNISYLVYLLFTFRVRLR